MTTNNTDTTRAATLAQQLREIDNAVDRAFSERKGQVVATEAFYIKLRTMVPDIASTLDALVAENARLREALCSMVAQHCRRRDSEQLDDWALSANEEALDLLAQLGDVKEVAGFYGRYEWAGRMLPQEPSP